MQFCYHHTKLVCVLIDYINNMIKEKIYITSCLICNSPTKNTEYLTQYFRDSNIFSDLRIEKCESCGFGHATPPLLQATISDFYTNEYRNSKSPLHIDFNNMSKPFARDHRAISQLLLALNYTSLEDGDTFVDIGPGPGNSFRELIEMFGEDKINLFAVEFSEDASDFYKRTYNVNTVTNFDEIMHQVAEKPKLLLSSHCLEHFTYNEATEFLEKINTSLSEDGCCVFEVPHVDFRLHEKSRGSDDPHFLFFSKNALKALFIKSGLDVLFIETCGPDFSKNISNPSDEKAPNLLIATIKNLIKSFLKFIPKKLRSSLEKKLYKINFQDENFLYGGDRTCLRIVARPAHSSNDQ